MNFLEAKGGATEPTGRGVHHTGSVWFLSKLRKLVPQQGHFKAASYLDRWSAEQPPACSTLLTYPHHRRSVRYFTPTPPGELCAPRQQHGAAGAVLRRGWKWQAHAETPRSLD